MAEVGVDCSSMWALYFKCTKFECAIQYSLGFFNIGSGLTLIGTCADRVGFLGMYSQLPSIPLVGLECLDSVSTTFLQRRLF